VKKSTALNVTWREIQSLPNDAADHSVAYGAAPQQFGELRLPATKAPHAVVVFIHGGCWLNKYGVDHVAAASRALSKEGYAVWSPEYRRVGDVGGGWPGTFEDISNSVRTLHDLAEEYALDLERVIVMGHSAGGHLALWLAAQKNNTLPIQGVISLAGIADLLAYEALANECASSLPDLLGGTSFEQSARWAAVDPMRLRPFRVPTVFIHGELDDIVPLSQSVGMGGTLHVVGGGGHFDMLSPHSEAFKTICQTLKSS
jgi:acetyl esterase/lipase